MRLAMYRIQGGPFRFGYQAGLGMEESMVTWPADSLFAALVARLAVWVGSQNLTAYLQPFLEGRPPFLLTSTFPFVQGRDGPIYFFPVPLAARRPPAESLPQGLRPKDLKKVRFVSEGLFRALLKGEPLAARLNKEYTLHEGAVAFSPEEWQRLPGRPQEEEKAFRLWKVEKRPRVTVDRATNSSNLFYVAAVHFPQSAGLWFGVVWRDESSPWKDVFEHLLQDLGESGLGAERSVGYGQATIEPAGTMDLPDPVPGHPWTTLSRYLPRQEEMPAFLEPTAAYTLVRVGGWVDGVGQRRRRITLASEGATLVWANGLPVPPWGQIVDVRPTYASNPDPLGHPVYRYGYALAVGLSAPPTETR